MMRMSKGFGVRWQQERMDDLLTSLRLEPRLSALVEAPLIRRPGGLLLLDPLVAHATGPEAFQDRTGYEAFVNKFHVDDFLDDSRTTDTARRSILFGQGVKPAVRLSERLESEGPYRVLLSLDAELPTMTVRFFERRQVEPWGAEDPDAFPLEEVLMIDTRA